MQPIQFVKMMEALRCALRSPEYRSLLSYNMADDTVRVLGVDIEFRSVSIDALREFFMAGNDRRAMMFLAYELDTQIEAYCEQCEVRKMLAHKPEEAVPRMHAHEEATRLRRSAGRGRRSGISGLESTAFATYDALADAVRYHWTNPPDTQYGYTMDMNGAIRVGMAPESRAPDIAIRPDPAVEGLRGE